MSALAGRLAAITARIARAAERSGRDPDAVRLVGASKLQPVARLREAYDAGLRRFGENRVQEGIEKSGALPADVEWHLLGPLQSNKVHKALERFAVFHAVDRMKIAEALDVEAGRRGLAPAAMIEVNLGGEATKHGFAPGELAAESPRLAGLAHLRIVGLMTIPPPADDPERTRTYFRRLAELGRELDRRPEWSGRLVELSMGMSDDFEIAVEEGATYVRVGTRLFGTRGSG